MDSIRYSEPALEGDLQAIEATLVAATPESLAAAEAALLQLLARAKQGVEFAADDRGRIERLRLLAQHAAESYQGWIDIVSARMNGYSNSGAPAPIGIASVNLEG